MIGANVVTIGENNTAHLVILDINIIYSSFEAHLSAEGENCITEILNDFDKAIGADVGLIDIENFWHRSSVDELL